MVAPAQHREVTLPIGFRDEAGTWQRSALLRKMRGHEEALLYDPELAPGQLVTALLAGCLLRLGELESVPPAAVSELYTADRNYLLLELRRHTLGDQLPASYRCPSCGHTLVGTEDLSAVEVRRLSEGEEPEEIELVLEDGYVDRRGTVHTELTLSLPRGIDEEFVGDAADSDPLKARDVLLLRCIRRFGSLPRAELDAYGVKILCDLTLGDRRAIDQALQANAPGIELTRHLTCPSCALEFADTLDMSRFFFDS